MRHISKIWFGVLLTVSLAGFFGSSTAHAMPALTYSITPIVGYERVQEVIPTPHTKDRLLYGARLTAGLPLLSLEAEYTRANSSEDFRPAPDLMTKDDAQKLKIGVRSSPHLTAMIYAIGRAGVQAKKNHHEETVGGVTTAVDQPIVYKPYGGVGFRVGLAPKIAATGEIVAVFNKFPDMSQNEYETTIGLTISVP